jgi:hypothetical protein
VVGGDVGAVADPAADVVVVEGGDPERVGERVTD